MERIGKVLHWDGVHWRTIESQNVLALDDITVTLDGEVWACGHSSVLRLLETPEP